MDKVRRRYTYEFKVERALRTFTIDSLKISAFTLHELEMNVRDNLDPSVFGRVKLVVKPVTICKSGAIQVYGLLKKDIPELSHVENLAHLGTLRVIDCQKETL